MPPANDKLRTSLGLAPHHVITYFPETVRASGSFLRTEVTVEVCSAQSIADMLEGRLPDEWPQDWNARARLREKLESLRDAGISTRYLTGDNFSVKIGWLHATSGGYCKPDLEHVASYRWTSLARGVRYLEHLARASMKRRPEFRNYDRCGEVDVWRVFHDPTRLMEALERCPNAVRVWRTVDTWHDAALPLSAAKVA